MNRRAVFASGLLAMLLATACAAEPADSAAPIAAADDEVRGDTLREITVVRGKVRPGETVTIAYQPTHPSYAKAAERARVPFLAVEIVDDDALPPPGSDLQTQNRSLLVGPPQSVTVVGEFPGAPRVLVVDEQFRVAAATSAITVDGIERAELDAPTGPGKRFVLVRDGLWTAPMTFDVTVGR